MKIKTLLHIIILAILALPNQNLNAGKVQAKKATVAAICASVVGAALAIGALIYRLNPDRSSPTLDKLNVVTFIPIEDAMSESVSQDDKAVITTLKKQQGVIRVNKRLYRIHSGIPDAINQQKEPVFLYAGGYSNGCKPYAFCVHRAMEMGTITGPCVVFEYAPDYSPRAFNFCQKQDLDCLSLVYEDLVSKHPNGQVIFYGACKGAANKLRFLAEKAEEGEVPTNIQAAIVESPTISPKDALKDIRNGGPISHALCRLVFPNYSPNLKTIMHAQAFPNDIPVLLGSLPDDTLSALPDMIAMKEHLEKQGAQVEHLICTGEDAKIRHGRIRLSSQWQRAVQQFLLKHKLKATANKQNAGQ